MNKDSQFQTNVATQPEWKVVESDKLIFGDAKLSSPLNPGNVSVVDTSKKSVRCRWSY